MNRLCVGIGFAGLLAAMGCNALVGVREGTLIDDTAAAGGQGGSGQGGSGQGGSGQGGSGQGGQTGSSAVTSSNATTGTGMATEDCLDGMDNDNDGQIDCADAACQPGFECTGQAPSGWTEYVRVHVTPYGTSAGITCPGGSAPLHYFASPAGPVQCSACQCNLQGTQCGAPELSCYFGNSNCAGSPDISPQSTTGNCIGNLPLGGQVIPSSCRLTADAMLLAQGTCSTSGGTPTNPNPPLWTQDVLLCGGPQVGAGCAAGQVCVPKGGGDFTGNVCITRPGPAMCPAGWNPDVQAYGSATDSRACSACSCTPGCAGGGYVVHDVANCQPPDMTQHPDVPITSSTCVDVGDIFDNNFGSLTPQLAQPTPTCSGGTPTGQVTPQDPLVICCP